MIRDTDRDGSGFVDFDGTFLPFVEAFLLKFADLGYLLVHRCRIQEADDL